MTVNRARASARVEPWWAILTVWVVVNAVNLLQSVGFLSRIYTGDRSINHALGYAIVALVIPATVALFAFIREQTGWQFVPGPLLFAAFTALSLAVDYIWLVEFRNPARPAILVPYLLLFFGSIVLMGAPMLRIDRRLWVITAVTSVMLVLTMGLAMRAGVG